MNSVNDQDLSTASDQDLTNLLITLDFKGKEIKQKALDILLQREHTKAFYEGYECDFVGDLK